MKLMRLLVTRPEQESHQTAALLRSQGHEVVVVPMLHIESVAEPQLGTGPWAGVLFTSANAVRAISTHRRFRELVRLPAYVVGSRTRTAAVAVGFSSAVSADGNVDDLVALMTAQPAAGDLPLIYLAGSDVAGDLAGALQMHGLRVETAVVYRSIMVADLREDVCAALVAGDVDAVLHYSARTSAAFLGAAVRAGITDAVLRVRHVCLSPRVAAPLIEAGAATVVIAEEPNEEALFARIAQA